MSSDDIEIVLEYMLCVLATVIWMGIVIGCTFGTCWVIDRIKKWIA